MGFEIYAPSTRADSIKPGECSINKSGMLTCCASDLHRAGITNGHVVVLVDKLTFRIALRASTGVEPTCVAKANKSKTSVLINIRSLIASILSDRAKAAGRRPLSTKDNMLIVQIK